MLAGAALTALSAGLFLSRRKHETNEAAKAALEAERELAGRTARARVRLGTLLRALGKQNMGAWQYELALFVRNRERLEGISESDDRLSLVSECGLERSGLSFDLPPPSEDERTRIQRNAHTLITQDNAAQRRADEVVDAAHTQLNTILAEKGLTNSSLREHAERLERRRMTLERLIPEFEHRIETLKHRQPELADPIREAGEAIALLTPGEDNDAIAYHKATRVGLIEEVRQMRAESAKLYDRLPGLRSELAALEADLDALLEVVGGRFEYVTVAGIEQHQLVLSIDEDRSQVQPNRLHSIGLAKIAARAIEPASTEASSGATESDTIRWIMATEAPQAQPITVLGGVSLSAATHQATITGVGGDPGELNAVLRTLQATERVLREWLDAVELLRTRSGAIQHKLRRALHGNHDYRTMSDAPLPGAFFGPRLLVWRSHQFSRALLLLIDSAVLESDGRIASCVPRRLEVAITAARCLDGWQSEPSH